MGKNKRKRIGEYIPSFVSHGRDETLNWSLSFTQPQAKIFSVLLNVVFLWSDFMLDLLPFAY
jgi:hypothetical protein